MIKKNSSKVVYQKKITTSNIGGVNSGEEDVAKNNSNPNELSVLSKYRQNNSPNPMMALSNHL